MRLYHFTNKKFGLEALEKKRLKIARISELNDPFELLAWKFSDAAQRQRQMEWKLEADRKIGIVCFSSKWSNPLLWAHYADKHKGMALGFDVADADIYRPVRYIGKRLNPPTGQKIGQSDLEEILTTKFSHWRYETEYRGFCILINSIFENGTYFDGFSENIRLVEVVVGYEAEISRSDLVEAIGPHHQDVTLIKARPAFGTFKVVENRKRPLRV